MAWDFTGQSTSQNRKQQWDFSGGAGNSRPAPVQDENPERKRPTLNVGGLVDQGVFNSAEPAPAQPKQFRPRQAFESAVQEAPGYKLLDKGLAAADRFLGNAPPAPKPEFKPQGAEWAPYIAGKIVGEAPTVALAYATGGAGAAALTPEASALIPAAETFSQLAARGAGAGATHGLFRQAVEGKPLSEGLPEAALETAGFMVGDPALSWAGKQVGRLLKPKRQFDFSKPTPSVSEAPSVPKAPPSRAPFKTATPDYTINNAWDFTGGRGDKDYSSVPDYGYPSNYLNRPARSGVRESITEFPRPISKQVPKSLRQPGAEEGYWYSGQQETDPLRLRQDKGSLYLTNDIDFARSYATGGKNEYIHKVKINPEAKAFDTSKSKDVERVANSLFRDYNNDKLDYELSDMIERAIAENGSKKAARERIIEELSPNEIRNESIYDNGSFQGWLYDRHGFDVVKFWDENTALLLNLEKAGINNLTASGIKNTALPIVNRKIPEKIGRAGKPVRTIGAPKPDPGPQFPLPFTRAEEPAIQAPKPFEKKWDFVGTGRGTAPDLPPTPPELPKITPILPKETPTLESPKIERLPDPDTPQDKLYQQTGVNITEWAKGWRDKAKLLLKRETPERNFEAVMGRDAPKMINKFIAPVHRAESDRIRWLNTERANIASLGIRARSKESRLVQQYGEGLISEEELRRVSPLNWQKIKNAAGFTRQKYDTYLDDINAVLTRNGYDPIPKRQDYFRHFEDVTGLFEQYGIPRSKLEDLPTDINGITADFKPGRNFFASALRRKGNKTTYDAITGIDGYIAGASRVMFHTDNIQRLRLLEKALRREYAETDHLTNFTAELGEYTNILAGKKAMFDRAAEDLLGRSVYVGLDKMRHQVGANMIGANVASALTQFIPLTQSLATTSKPAMARALMNTLANVVRNDGFVKQSDFLARRYGSDPLSLNLWQKGSHAAGWLFRTIDRFVSETIVRGKYYEGLDKGLNPRQAMGAADEWSVRVMADRTLGAMPTLFSSRTLGLFTQFQLEVNNQISFLLKDIPAGSETKLGTASAVAQLFLYGYLFNNIFEKVAGYRPALDPVGVAKRAYEDYSNPRVRTTTATRNLMWNTANQLPFASALTGGRIPVGAAVPNPMKIASGESTAWKEIQKPVTYLLPPFGGGQAKKTLLGLDVAGGGGVYQDNKLKFPVTPSPGLYVFGPNSTPEAREYYKNDRRPLSEKQTVQFRQAGGTKGAYKRILQKREMEGIERKISETENDRKLNPQEKTKKIMELMRRRNKAMVGGSR